MSAGRALLLAGLWLAAVTASAGEPPAGEAKAVEQAPAPQTHTPEEEMAALRPVLIGKRYLDQARQRLAVQLARMRHNVDNPGPWLEDNALLVRDFIADLQVMYALEFPEGARLVSHGMVKGWGMDPERVHQRALANLEGKHGELHIKPLARLPWLYVIDAEDGYAASRILLHWRWGELTLKLGDVLILGLPTRDVVVFTTTLEPEKIAQLREAVETVEQHQGRPITRRLFQWTPEGWKEF